MLGDKEGHLSFSLFISTSAGTLPETTLTNLKQNQNKLKHFIRTGTNLVENCVTSETFVTSVLSSTCAILFKTY